MKHTTFIFAGIISAIIGTAYAVGENTVTSKSYVDAMDALKQDAIDPGTTGAVVTYNGEDSNGQAQFDEVEIYDDSNNYTSSDSGKLITAGTVADMAETIESITIPDNKLTCYNSPDCTLWQISEGTVALTDAGTLAPLTAAACKEYGEPASSRDECCSHVLATVFGVSQCGCMFDNNCPTGTTCNRGSCTK